MRGVIFRDNEVIFHKNLNELDLFAIKISEIVRKFFRYVIVGGYVSILFGRSRSTEDIDIYINAEDVSIEKIKAFYDELDKNNFWCFNAMDHLEGYNLLNEGLGLRVAIKDTVIPNAEIKLPKSHLDLISLREYITVKLNEFEIRIGSLELNIAYKLYLGSQKDFEDALYLFCIFKEKLNYSKILSFCKELKVKKEVVERVLRC